MANERSAITASPLADGSDDALWAEVNRLAPTTPGGRAGALKALAKRGMGQPETRPLVMADMEAVRELLREELRAVTIQQPANHHAPAPSPAPQTRTRSGAKPL